MMIIRRVLNTFRQSFIVLRTVIRDISNFLNDFISDLAETDGIHGIRYIYNKDIHILERLTWILAIAGGIFGAFFVTIRQFDRYRLSPTVVSLDRNYRLWNDTLPAATICYYNHMDSYKADQYILEKWNISTEHEEYSYFIDFLYSVVNASVVNYESLTNYADDERFEDVDLFEIAKSVDRPFDQILVSYDEGIEINVQSVMSEKGMCYTFNSPIAELLGDRNVKINEIQHPVICQYGKQDCFIRLDIFEGTGEIEIHSPYEISGNIKDVIDVQRSDEILATYKITETVASDQLRDLSPEQRKCVFTDENTANLQIYSKSLCLSKCRAGMAYEMCNCIPFFYPFVDGPSCSPTGFECLNDFKWPVWALHVCKCPPTCTEQKYSLHALRKSSWGRNKNVPFEATSSFRWDIIPPKVKVRRDILFSFEDLLVSCGGAASLFLGVSFLSLSGVYWVLIKYCGILLFRSYRCFEKIPRKLCLREKPSDDKKIRVKKLQRKKV